MVQRREYFYDLDDRGVLSLEGFVQDDPWFLDFMSRRIASSANTDYPEYAWVFRCGDEMNYVKVADTPLVFQRLAEQRLWFSPSQSVHFNPTQLRYSEQGVLYHPAPVGEFARIVPSLAIELADAISPCGPHYTYHDVVHERQALILPRELPSTMRVLFPRDANSCVGCGLNNEHSIALTFLHDESTGEVFSYMKPTQRMIGSMTTVHGGWTSLLLDEVMGKGLSVRGLKAPTAQLNVRFRKPMLMDGEYLLSSRLVRQDGRKNWMHGTITDINNTVVVAEAEALFITVGTTSL